MPINYQGGGGGATPSGPSLTLIDTVTVDEAKENIYLTFPATKRVVLEITDLSQNNTSGNAVVAWAVMNNNGYVQNKAFNLHQTTNSGGVVFGTQYKCNCLVDMKVWDNLVSVDIGGIFGTGNDFVIKTARKVEDVGDTLSSVYLYLPSQSIAPGAVINIWAEQ